MSLKWLKVYFQRDTELTSRFQLITISPIVEQINAKYTSVTFFLPLWPYISLHLNIRMAGNILNLSRNCPTVKVNFIFRAYHTPEGEHPKWYYNGSIKVPRIHYEQNTRKLKYTGIYSLPVSHKTSRHNRRNNLSTEVQNKMTKMETFT